MTEPTVAIMLLTYGADADRAAYARQALGTTLGNLRYGGPLAVHIADDGSPLEHRVALEAMARDAGVEHVTVTDAARAGYGASYNLATQVVHTYAEIVLPLEDDWELVRPLELGPLIEALDDSRIGCIRLGYLGFSRPSLRGELVHLAGGTYFLIDPANDEPHVFAGHPRLETRSWERTVGPWPEGLQPGETEFQVCKIEAARRGVAWPAHLARPDSGDVFAHIGTVRSY